jgi:hypothetical protein
VVLVGRIQESDQKPGIGDLSHARLRPNPLKFLTGMPVRNDPQMSFNWLPSDEPGPSDRKRNLRPVRSFTTSSFPLATAFL